MSVDASTNGTEEVDRSDADSGGELGLTVVGTSSAGFERKSTNLHDLQLHPQTLASIPGVEEGDFLKLVVRHEDRHLEFYGRVEACDDRFDADIGRDEIGVGIHCRKGLAVAIGDDVTVRPSEFEPITPGRRLMNRALKFRPAACRVRKSTSPDSGYRVCRTSPEVKDLLGIEWGDRVVVQSANGRIRGVKALPLREQLREKFDRRQRAAPQRYPPPFPETDVADRAGIEVDLPRLHLSASAREDLGLAGDGVYQPVKVHRDTSDVFVRLVHGVSVPVVLGAATVIVGFDIGLAAKAVVLVVALVAAVSSVWLYARRIMLR